MSVVTVLWTVRMDCHTMHTAAIKHRYTLRAVNILLYCIPGGKFRFVIFYHHAPPPSPWTIHPSPSESLCPSDIALRAAMLCNTIKGTPCISGMMSSLCLVTVKCGYFKLVACMMEWDRLTFRPLYLCRQSHWCPCGRWLGESVVQRGAWSLH